MYQNQMFVLIQDRMLRSGFETNRCPGQVTYNQFLKTVLRLMAYSNPVFFV